MPIMIARYCLHFFEKIRFFILKFSLRLLFIFQNNTLLEYFQFDKKFLTLEIEY